MVSIGLDEIACVFVGRVEVATSKEIVDTRFKVDRTEQVRRVERSTKSESYDAFTIFDIYGATSLRARLLESICTIEGPEYPKAKRGAGFARFAKWLGAQSSSVHVDETYLQLGKEDRRSERSEDGRLLAHGHSRSKEVVGIEQQYSGQEFDDYSVIAWTVWRLANERGGEG